MQDAIDPGLESKLATVRRNLAQVALTAVVEGEGEQDVLMLEHNLTVGEALRVSRRRGRPIGRAVSAEPGCRCGTALQVLAKRRVLSAPLVISPGLEDTESLVPG